MAATNFDWANYLTTVKAIIKDVFQYDGTGPGSGLGAFGLWRAPSANRWRGHYWDLYGGAGNLSVFQLSPSVDPNGNHGDWEANKAELALYERTQMRALDAGFYQTTENVEEGLIGSGFDFMHLGVIGELVGLSQWGANVGSFSIVYSRFQCMFNLGITFNDVFFQDASQVIFYTMWVNFSFHQTGGHLSVSNPVVTGIVVPTDPPTLLNNNNFFLLVFMKSVIDKMNATPAIRTYMRTGYRMRPLPHSWEGHYADSGKELAAYLAEGSTNGTSPSDARLFSSVWWNPAADADYPATSNCYGIVITSCLTASTTYRIQIEANELDMPPTSVKVLYSRVGAVRTELTRFTESLDYTATITFDGATAPVLLFEVVQL